MFHGVISYSAGVLAHIWDAPSLWRCCPESLKVKENVFLLLNSIRARGGGLTRRALGSSMTESPLLRLSAAVTHFNSTLFLSHWNPSTMTFNKGRRVKTWLFLHILPPSRLGRGPAKGINQCSLTALPSGNDLSLFCAQKWHINLKMDMHKLYIQLLRLCLRSVAVGKAVTQSAKRPARPARNCKKDEPQRAACRDYNEDDSCLLICTRSSSPTYRQANTLLMGGCNVNIAENVKFFLRPCLQSRVTITLWRGLCKVKDKSPTLTLAFLTRLKRFSRVNLKRCTMIKMRVMIKERLGSAASRGVGGADKNRLHYAVHLVNKWNNGEACSGNAGRMAQNPIESFWPLAA